MASNTAGTVFVPFITITPGVKKEGYKKMYYQKRQNKVIVRKCIECEKEYTKNPKYSVCQWRITKFCSLKCSGLNKKKRDGFLNKGERYRRKIGMLKQGTPEWLERIRSTTKNAMQKPNVKEKLHNPRGPQSIESRIKKSNKLAGKLPANMMYNSNNYPNVQRGEYDINGKTIYFRSKWEANYALYLDFLIKNNEIKSWEFEKDVFIFDKINFGTRSYRPDFKILNNDNSIEYHEVKGYMDERSKTKLKRMIKYYPEIKLVLIDSPIYKDLVKKVGVMCGFF